MLLHISIPAREPKTVAEVLAQLCEGIVKPFVPLNGAYMVYANDEFASGFEVYPETILLEPGNTSTEASRFVEYQTAQRFSSTHCAMRTALSKSEVEAIAAERGWRCLYTSRRDLFNVYELWLENHFLLEVIISEDWPSAKKHLTCN